jgi:hypothetical protein
MSLAILEWHGLGEAKSEKGACRRSSQKVQIWAMEGHLVGDGEAPK